MSESKQGMNSGCRSERRKRRNKSLTESAQFAGPNFGFSWLATSFPLFQGPVTAGSTTRARLMAGILKPQAGPGLGDQEHNNRGYATQSKAAGGSKGTCASLDRPHPTPNYY